MLSVKDEFDVANLILTNAQFSYAMAVMDRIGGRIEGGRDADGSQIGGRLAASKAVICDGEKHMIDAVHWVCAQMISPS